MNDLSKQLLTGIELSRNNDWEAAHAVAQALEGDANADWLHAILHKIEGDAGNSRYWYSRTPHTYESFPDTQAELDALKAALSN